MGLRILVPNSNTEKRSSLHSVPDSGSGSESSKVPVSRDDTAAPPTRGDFWVVLFVRSNCCSMSRWFRLRCGAHSKKPEQIRNFVYSGCPSCTHGYFWFTHPLPDPKSR